MENNGTSASEGFPLQYIQGLPFPLGFGFSKEDILSAIAYHPRDDDIILASYPKTGSMWMHYIILQIINGPEYFPKIVDLLSTLSPYMELVGASRMENVQPPRVLRTHFTYELVPKNGKAKYIYTFRDPRDVFVSYYHFLTSMGCDEFTLDHVLECFLSGCVPYGEYFEHLQTWFSHRNDHQILFVCYEHHMSDPRKHVLKVAEFLGEQYLNRLKSEDGIIEKILANTSFDHMKKNLRYNPRFGDLRIEVADERVSPIKGSAFFRKGIVGDWKNHLSAEQIRLLEEKAREKLDDRLLKLWNI